MKQIVILSFWMSTVILTSCNSLSQEDQIAYDLLVESGNTFLTLNEIELAKKDFNNALHIDPDGKDAYIGLYNSYQTNCKLYTLDCHLAQHLADSLKIK